MEKNPLIKKVEGLVPPIQIGLDIATHLKVHAQKVRKVDGLRAEFGVPFGGHHYYFRIVDDMNVGRIRNVYRYWEYRLDDRDDRFFHRHRIARLCHPYRREQLADLVNSREPNAYLLERFREFSWKGGPYQDYWKCPDCGHEHYWSNAHYVKNFPKGPGPIAFSTCSLIQTDRVCFCGFPLPNTGTVRHCLLDIRTQVETAIIAANKELDLIDGVLGEIAGVQ